MPTILVIDDDATFCRLVGRRLESAGYRAIVAGGVEDGWALLEAQRPDLVLLDLVLPQLDGVEFLRRLRSHPALRDTPVRVVSALSFVALNRAAASLGAREQLVKSRFSLRDLALHVGAVLPPKPAITSATRPAPHPSGTGSLQGCG